MVSCTPVTALILCVQVEEIALQHTTLLRWDGVKIWYPNARLCLEPIMNVARSSKRWEAFKVSCSVLSLALCAA